VQSSGGWWPTFLRDMLPKPIIDAVNWTLYCHANFKRSVPVVSCVPSKRVRW